MTVPKPTDGFSYERLYLELVDDLRNLLPLTIIDSEWVTPDNPSGIVTGREWLEARGLTFRKDEYNEE